MNITRRNIGVHLDNKEASVVVWAPLVNEVQLQAEGQTLPLQKDAFGYWTTRTSNIKEGSRYRFLVDGKAWPDPASLSQPDGVHEASEVIDLSYDWNDKGWNNLPLADYILYELHTGTFTPEGTFAAIETKLDYLKSLGVNAIEIMPVAQFPGSRNWGYDGVYPFAVQNSYGGAKGLQHLVDTCHQKGIAVVLDVVYNHLGPEGNYLGVYGPYFTEKYKTPWGGALNFDDAWCDGVRQYFIENALMWFRDFHIDALRLDAVHAIKDFSPQHILREIRLKVDELVRQSGRQHYLIAELDLNDTRYINPVQSGGYGMDAQWIDEFHHALRVTAGGDNTGYYADFKGVEHLAKAFKDAYVYDGQWSPHRNKKFGIRAEQNSGEQFIVFSQNHDQVGNRMLGERTSVLASFEMQKLLAAAVMVSPYLPMLFMGEEWSEPHPFLYFVSHTDKDLAAAVRKGRKEEFAAFHAQGEAPDPMDEETFLRSKLQWQVQDREPHATMLRYYKAVIQLRKTHPALAQPDRKHLHVECTRDNNTLFLHRWHKDQHVVCGMNFSKKEQYMPPPSYAPEWYRVFDSSEAQWQGPGSRAAMQVAGSRPGATMIVMQPESIVIYSNQQRK